MAIATSSPPPKVPTLDKCVLQVSKGAVSDVEDEGLATLEAVGENPSWNHDLRGDYQHKLPSGEDYSREEVGSRTHVKRYRGSRSASALSP